MAKKGSRKTNTKKNPNEEKLKGPANVLTKDAEEIRIRYAHLGLSNLLSAGLVLFKKACDTQKMDALDEANGWKI